MDLGLKSFSMCGIAKPGGMDAEMKRRANGRERGAGVRQGSATILGRRCRLPAGNTARESRAPNGEGSQAKMPPAGCRTQRAGSPRSPYPLATTRVFNCIDTAELAKDLHLFVCSAASACPVPRSAPSQTRGGESKRLEILRKLRMTDRFWLAVAWSGCRQSPLNFTRWYHWTSAR